MDDDEIRVDHYRILQVHHNAGQEVVEAAYKRLCKIYHPDINKNRHADERIREINESYNVLKNPTLRRTYHRRWLQSRFKARHPVWDSNDGDAAYQVLKSYFQDLMDGMLDDAYLKLSSDDIERIRHQDFIRWQEHVARIYRIGSFTIRLFRSYHHCKIYETVYKEVKEFSVYIQDMDIRTGAINENTFVKYMVLEEDGWNVCLGYKEVKSLIRKYVYMEDNPRDIDPQVLYNEEIMRYDGLTGKLSRHGFLKQAESELLRSRRYGNIFSVALLEIIPLADTELTAEELRLAAHMTSSIFSGNTRNMDIIGRWSNAEFVLLLPETSGNNAMIVCEKLAEITRHTGSSIFAIRYGVSELAGGSIEDTILAASADLNIRAGISDETVSKTIFAENIES